MLALGLLLGLGLASPVHAGTMISADFNRDGALDLAAFGSIRLGDGAGSFGPAAVFLVGQTLDAMVTADFNRDGVLDLAVADAPFSFPVPPGAVSILLGVGDGSFGAATPFTVGARPRSVATGDLNNDGIADLVTANEFSHDVSILLGDGTGSFGPATSLAVFSNPSSVAIGDVNGDGNLDLAVPNGGTVSIFLGTGTGSFGAAIDSGGAGIPMVMGDLNGDGNLDLVMVIGGSDRVAVLLGDGTGSFGPATAFVVGEFPQSVKTSDLNGDGELDLVVEREFNGGRGANAITFLLGDGTGSFGTPTTIHTGRTDGIFPVFVAIGDLNRDGEPDLAVLDSGAGTVTVVPVLVFLSPTPFSPSGSFGPAMNFATGAGPSSVAIGDLNRDGRADLALANDNANTVSVLLGDGTGSFGAKSDFTTGLVPLSVALGDLNRDGKLDLAVANSDGDTVSVLLGDGTGSFGAKSDFATGRAPFSVALGDLNRDGKPDLVTANGFTISLLLGDGAGSFGPKTDFPTGGGSPRSIAIGDLNGDGKSDLVVARAGASAVSVFVGDGAGGFGEPTAFPTGLLPVSVAIADLNGDGRPDLVTANAHAGTNTASVLLEDGTGSFGPNTDFPTGDGPQSVAIADLNRDGQPDLVTANSRGNTGSVLLGDGTGSFGAPTDFPAGVAPISVAIADLNGDGRLDLALANFEANSVSVVLNGPLELSLATNAATFAPGDSLIVAVGVDNPGIATSPRTRQVSPVDFFFGALLPDGDTVVFFTDLSFNTGVGSLASPNTLQTIVAGVDLTTPFVFNDPAFFTFTWSGTEPSGSYILFFAAVVSGALADNSIDAGDIVALSTATITFTP
ncbi:MAG: FG-GAP repeat domain-containing protein [Thermoplasmata archaeon]